MYCLLDNLLKNEWFQRQGISSCPATSLPCVYKAGRGQARPCLVWPRHPLSQGQDVVCTIGQIKMLIQLDLQALRVIISPQLLDKYCIVYTGLFFSSPKGKGKAGFIYQFSVPMQQPICFCFCFRGSLYFNFHQIPSCLVQPMTSLDNWG